MGPRVIGGSRGVHNRKLVLIINRFQGSERRVQSKESVEVDGAAVAVRRGLRNCDLRPEFVIVFVTERYNHRNAICSSTLKDGNNDRLILSPARLFFREGR